MSTDQKAHQLAAMQEGNLTLQGEFMWGSNYTFLLQVDYGGDQFQVVYKPTRGVRPLWDFPKQSLPRREVAAFLVSNALGLEFVPPTVIREDAPYGAGSLQLFIEHDPDYHYFNFTPTDRQRLRPVVLFDLLINNADRKGSHILIDLDRKIWLIDHGICFHVENKLRTVIWDFSGEPIPESLIAKLEAFHLDLDAGLNPAGQQPGSQLVEALLTHLSQREITALARRAGNLLASGCFPGPDPDRRHYPWPPV